MQKIKISLINLFDRLERITDTFGGNTVVLLAVSLVLAASMLVLNDRLIINTREKTDALSSLDSLFVETWQIRARLAIAESAQRGYLLTRSDEYFKPYDEATSQISRHLQAIDAILTKTSLVEYQEMQSTMNEFASSISKKSAEMSVCIDLAKKHQFDKALAVVRLDTGIKESRNIEALSKRFEQQATQLRFELAESRNDARRITRWCVMACPLIFVSLVVMVIRRLLRELAEKDKLHARLSNENTEYERNIYSLKTKLQRQALQAQTNIERERYKLSRELHDELGSLLTAIKMDLSWAIKNLKDQLPQVTEKLKKTNQYVDRSINFKREIVQNLHPAMIKSFGLIASLQNLIDEAAVRNQWQMDIIFPEQEMMINETVGLIIYRIVQESLNNCSKYAKATRVSVHLMHDDQHIKLEVADNGLGFDPNNLTNTTNGISGMSNRVESIGGHYEISSSPQHGASTRVLLPYLKSDSEPL
ncbi:CHASE3 domain-containing protein [Methylophilus aquaticus]|uniref:CHASE3 domain-containing protein n=1 Tax=Methylophilus aquaticus TaxID=1971610 RepID=A0ABT9JUR5_9PROT|nr:CHASE3 domain-containing protein [Methylophilus aquaticus]MDP8568297.1 CHASE3 domain-containing protein [Methylophilus aquaticus]